MSLHSHFPFYYQYSIYPIILYLSLPVMLNLPLVIPESRSLSCQDQLTILARSKIVMAFENTVLLFERLPWAAGKRKKGEGKEHQREAGTQLKFFLLCPWSFLVSYFFHSPLICSLPSSWIFTLLTLLSLFLSLLTLALPTVKGQDGALMSRNKFINGDGHHRMWMDSDGLVMTCMFKEDTFQVLCTALGPS